ncbi:Protein of unknown function [Pyronema omphalodes CBS 100304]|uniref:Uncharacterized protein n=1 Tax=Pyronema omphalodes (strain CBS 100304) TaxID=1076935 RepID=U4LTS5_PYROM|nr:Protein of unknown function [Pyronema omphalodes CBS 100304]
MSSTTTPTTSSKHGMTLRDRPPKLKPTGTTSTADNKSNNSSKVSKAAMNTNKASKNNKANKPKKIMARYIFSPEALQTLQFHKDNSNAQFVDGYLKLLSKHQKAPEEGIEIIVSVSEGFEFLGWTKGMVFRDVKFAKEMGMEM